MSIQPPSRDVRNRRFYDLAAPLYSWHRWRSLHRDSLAKTQLIDRFAPFDQELVLDMGTGPGVYAVEIARRYPSARVVGIDISEKFVSLARSKAAEANLDNVTFQVGNISSLQSEDETYDKIICAGVLCLVDEPEKALAELRRVLKKSGSLGIREPLAGEGVAAKTLRSVSPRLASMVGLMFGNFSPEYFSRDELERLTRAAGFSEMEISVHGGDAFVHCRK